jgi:hypothetical protein
MNRAFACCEKPWSGGVKKWIAFHCRLREAIEMKDGWNGEPPESKIRV